MSSRNTHQLKSFLANLTPQGKDAFAKQCSTTVGYLNQIMYGNSKCSASLAIKIDKESNGLVSCDLLCPDADFNYIRHQNPTPLLSIS
ncbi:helix-turn-helix domain-containing protein [Acinetobacter sp. NyZ410]|uniref:helix-turn-helix domain-containing protein n=1 Tax=Acinetobacter sp. NyZ410 TaxID=2929509 RepID=UPI001FB8A311|nr:helix-turn-helix domain-containing protein [Acinetobacter sp. NyZ410]UOH20442.1 helix-turn-helix domain-containing protein [Acinetobacter sp. NyZ410]